MSKLTVVAWLVACSATALADPPSPDDPAARAYVEAEASDHAARRRAEAARSPADRPSAAAAEAEEHRRATWERLRAYTRLESPEAIPPELTDELRRHARRVAEIDRLMELAETGHRGELVLRIDALAAREDRIHARRLGAIVARLRRGGSR
ncbi:MAG: hypothetical protein U0230_08950 [Polyangiales bacterium]